MNNNNLPESTQTALQEAKHLLNKYKETKDFSFQDYHELIKDLLNYNNRTIIYVILGGADITANNILMKGLQPLLNKYIGHLDNIHDTEINEDTINLKATVEKLLSRLPQLLKEVTALSPEETEQVLHELFEGDNIITDKKEIIPITKTSTQGKIEELKDSLKRSAYNQRRIIYIKMLCSYCTLDGKRDEISDLKRNFLEINTSIDDLKDLWSKENIERIERIGRRKIRIEYPVLENYQVSTLITYALKHNDPNDYVTNFMLSYDKPHRGGTKYDAFRYTIAYLEGMRDCKINQENNQTDKAIQNIDQAIQAYLNLKAIDKKDFLLPDETFKTMQNQILGRLVLLEEEKIIKTPELKKLFKDLNVQAKHLEMMKAHKQQMLNDGKDTENYDKIISHYEKLYNKSLYLDSLKKSISGYPVLGLGLITTAIISSYIASEAVRNVLSAISLNNVLDYMHQQFHTLGKIYMPGTDSIAQAVAPALIIGICTTILSTVIFTAVESVIRYSVSKDKIQREVQEEMAQIVPVIVPVI